MILNVLHGCFSSRIEVEAERNEVEAERNEVEAETKVEAERNEAPDGIHTSRLAARVRIRDLLVVFILLVMIFQLV